MKTRFLLFALLSVVLLTTIGVSAPTSYKIVVKKSERKLYLYHNDSLLKIYKIALGLNPIGPKEKQGDYKTPEGEYYICSKNDHSQFYLSLGLSYPNTSIAEQGLKTGLLSRSQYQQIQSAITHKRKPPMNTRLGGDIMIHGFGTARDWTWGCIAMENTDVKKLFNTIPVGTLVTIYP